MKHYAIRHLTHFSYDEPISETMMEVRMQPATLERQRCLQFVIETQPRARTFVYQDFLRNWVHYFDIPRRHRHLTITARAQVEVSDTLPIPDTLPLATWQEVERWATQAEYWDYRQPSQFAQWSDAVVGFVDSLAVNTRTRDPLGIVRLVMEAIHTQFEYAPNATRVDSPVDEVIESRRGVCQDFSHVMIATLRRVGLPVRYISGYIAPDNADVSDPTSIATHAWVEVCLPQLGWIGFDPTHNITTGTRHVQIASGRDYSDVPPTRGVFKGRAGSVLEVSVEINSAAAPAAVNDVPPAATMAWSAPRPDDSQEQQQQQQQQ